MGMKGTALILLALCGAAQGVLPPGFEDELYCPSGTCLRRRQDDEQLMVGPKASFYHCVDPAGAHVEDPTSWGSKLDHSMKDALLGKGYHMKTCETAGPHVAPCTRELKICPDGTGVGRTGPQCEFAPCPEATPKKSLCESKRDDVIKSGLLGACVWRCEADGSFSSRQCQGQHCWCVNPTTGEQIGEKKLGSELAAGACQTKPEKSLCESKRDDVIKSGLLGACVWRCEADGSFSSRQCQGQHCWCVNPTTGEQIGEKKLGSELAAGACQTKPEKSLCESKRDDVIKSGLLGACVWRCEADGSFSSRQCQGQHCWCVNPTTGEQIGEKKLGSELAAGACRPREKSPCEQQRDSVRPGLLGAFIPHCEEDGSYKRRQCRGSTGMCWCVDPRTGEKLMELARGSNAVCDISAVSKPTKPTCEEVRSKTPKLLGAFIPHCEEDGSYKRRQCHGSTGMCWCVDPGTGKKLPAIDGVNEGEACESRCDAARSRALSSNSLTAFIPECNAKDIFRSCQCNRMKECRCVDKYTGEPAMCRAAGGCQPFVATVVAADPALGNGTYYTLQNANRYRFRLTRESVNSTDVAEGDEMLVALGNDGWATLVQPLPRQGAAQNHASGLPWAAVLAGVGAAAVLAVAAIFAANYRNARQFREVPDSSDVESVANESRARNGSCYVQEEESPGLAS
eukprot:TRINITY_DN517_c0_g2_i7.p1 TRINITY_DN517_c0_g2~~TRINITY_DN517_c0_g2_i7.p1  ORF type:complete len:682 (+),score=72.69 TRINITY_DN517_c0_g2_i7:81-2126(+)